MLSAGVQRRRRLLARARQVLVQRRARNRRARVGHLLELAWQEVRHEAAETEVGRSRSAAQQVNDDRDHQGHHRAARDQQPTALSPVRPSVIARVKAAPVPARGERLHRIGLGPGRRRIFALLTRRPLLLELRRGLLLRLVLRGLLIRPWRLPRPGLIGLGCLPLPGVAAARVTAAITVAARRLTALRVARTGSARVAAVAARLGGLPLLRPLPAAVPGPGLPWTDGGEVRELPLVLRCGVIPLPLGHVAFLTCPAATRSAGE